MSEPTRGSSFDDHSGAAVPAITNRLLADESDVERVVSLVRNVRPVELITDYPSVVDLPQLLALPQNRTTMRLWFSDADRLLGFAWVDAFHTLRFELAWQDAPPGLEDAIMAWGDACLRRMRASDPGPLLLYATCHEADIRRHALLMRYGFQPLADSIVHMLRTLAAPVPAPQLPPDFSMRPVAGEQEAASIAALHRAAFGTPHMTTERRLGMMRSATYDPALDLVVITPDGALAAYSMGSISDEENMMTGRNACYADLFATDPAYRGQGLAHALMATLLQLLRSRGFDAAKLSTSSNNVAMQRVATSFGFRIAATTHRFSRVVVDDVTPFE